MDKSKTVLKNKKNKKHRRVNCDKYFLLTGTCLLLIGLGFLMYFEDLFDAIIRHQLTFNPESNAFLKWRTQALPHKMDFYFFNWTNPEAILDPTQKLKFEEIGPYRFQAIKDKVNITWNDNSTVTFSNIRKYFADENSPRKLTDILTTINAIAVSAAYKYRHHSYFTKQSVSLPLSLTSRMYTTKTARELLFDGYTDPFLSSLSPFSFLMDSKVEPEFGFFRKRNNSVGMDGVFNMMTNVDEKFGSLSTWNYDSKTIYYEGTCSEIHGSAGELFTINQKKDYVQLFSGEVCRDIILHYDKEVDVDGILGYKYITSIELFDNGTYNPDTACYCDSECLPSGVLNSSRCKQNSPVFVSLPHFYQADPCFLDPIEGLTPERDKHEFFIILEPKSGVVIDVGIRIQINMLLQPVKDIRMFENVPKVLIPVFWFDQRIEHTAELKRQLKLIQITPLVGDITTKVMIALGLFLIIIYFLRLILHKDKKVEKFETGSIIITAEEIPLRTQ